MKDTIKLAREVYGAHTEWSGAPLERLKQFEALVREDEREACAKVCEQYKGYGGNLFAPAIRARGNT
jgi:hypothetical protein